MDGGWEILKTSFVTAPNILFRNIVASGEDAIFDSSQVNLDILRANVDQHDFETANSRINHHLQIVLSGQRGLNGKALGLGYMFFCGFQDAASGSYWKAGWHSGLQCLANGVRVKQGYFAEELNVGGQSSLAGAVGTGNQRQPGFSHRVMSRQIALPVVFADVQREFPAGAFDQLPRVL